MGVLSVRRKKGGHHSFCCSIFSFPRARAGTHNSSSHGPDSTGEVPKGGKFCSLSTEPPPWAPAHPGTTTLFLKASNTRVFLGSGGWFLTPPKAQCVVDAHSPAREGPAPSPNNFFTDFSVIRLQDKAEISNTSEIFFTPVLLQTT